MADPVVSLADTPAWDYADVLDGPLYVAREPRDGDRPAIKSGHFTILTAGDYFDGGGPVIDRLEWLCQIANERPLLVEAAPAVSGRWHGLYAGTADEQAMVNREALAALLAERAALLAVGERDKADLAQYEAALASIETILFGDGQIRSRDRLEARAEELVAAGERDRRQIAQLTEALRQIASPRTIGSRDVFKAIARDALAAVLRADEAPSEDTPDEGILNAWAGEEDARP